LQDLVWIAAGGRFVLPSLVGAPAYQRRGRGMQPLVVAQFLEVAGQFRHAGVQLAGAQGEHFLVVRFERAYRRAAQVAEVVVGGLERQMLRVVELLQVGDIRLVLAAFKEIEQGLFFLLRGEEGG
jgi:hypothetical protein